jgi:hypothetical protein
VQMRRRNRNEHHKGYDRSRRDQYSIAHEA